jgi:hypothetical protein
MATERLTHFRLFLSTVLVAAGAWLIAGWLARLLAFSRGVNGIVAFCAIWIALYPYARRNRDVPAWMHWARGVFVLAVFWVFARLTT